MATELPAPCGCQSRPTSSPTIPAVRYSTIHSPVVPALDRDPDEREQHEVRGEREPAVVHQERRHQPPGSPVGELAAAPFEVVQHRVVEQTDASRLRPSPRASRR